MKKYLSLVLSVLMVFSLLSFASAEEPFTITVMLPDFYTDKDFQTEDNPTLKAIEAASGVKLDIQWVANSAYGDMTSLTLTDPASMPMLMVLTGARDPAVINSCRAGAFWDLTDYVRDSAAYPNLAGNETVYNNISIDGRIYGIYRSRAYPRAGIYYRSDIAEKAGVTKEPETIEELTALAEALAQVSPDTYALNMCKYVAGTINIITVAYGAPQTWGVNENGDIYPAIDSPAYLEGLKWLRHLYEIGGIDPDFMTIESGNWDSIERTSKAFMRFDCLDNCYRQQEWFENNEGVKEQIFNMIGGLKKADGSITIWPQNPGFAGEIVIPKTAVSEADLPKVLKFLDWANTAEGQMLLNWGVDGETYWVHEDGFRYAYPEDAATDEEKAKYSDTITVIQHSLNQLGMNIAGDLCIPGPASPLRNEYAQINMDYAQYAVPNPCFPLTSETDVLMGATLAQNLEDAAVQFIAGIIDEDALKAAWQQWKDEGGAMITEEYNAAYHAAMGN